jgi:hypothetical protein
MTIRSVTASALILGLLSTVSSPTLAAGTLRVPDGTPVPVRLMQQLSSATAKSGDTVTFELLEDLVIDGQLVSKRGTPARGAIVEATAKRRMGRAGNLSYTILETRAVDGQTIKLRATQERQGDSKVASTAVVTTAVAVFVPVAAPFVLLRKGKDTTVASGTRVDAFVDGDHTLRVDDALPAEATVATSQAGVMTNADVIGLIKARFSDDLIVAKIRASRRAFSLETSDLLVLKNAGASEKVLGAMLQP